jgi:hypothetical protein
VVLENEELEYKNIYERARGKLKEVAEIRTE